MLTYTYAAKANGTTNLLPKAIIHKSIKIVKCSNEEMESFFCPLVLFNNSQFKIALYTVCIIRSTSNVLKAVIVTF